MTEQKLPKSGLTKISDVVWELPKSYKKGMRVPVRFIGTEKLIDALEEVVFEQSANTACLPGLVGYVYVMPDAHSGYGVPIGCVFASDLKAGIVSPGAVGFDISCGMRLITTNLTLNEVQPRIKKLVNELYNHIPVGIGGRGFLKLSKSELEQVMVKGAQDVIEKGYGWDEDRQHMEEHGATEGADPDKVSARATERGLRQLATLGSGNHYLEVQKVDQIFDKAIAKKMGITDMDQIVVMVHSGSRGFGHQIATDYLRIFEGAMEKYGIHVPDRQLACAPFESREGSNYLAAMSAAANFAFANRQALTHQVRIVFAKVFGRKSSDLAMHLVYDVAHNIAKLEKFQIPNSKCQTNSNVQNSKIKTKTLLVHRKGATKSFGPGEEELPKAYRDIGQPVIIGGSMETGSYLLLGTKKAMTDTFGSTAHGSGRTMSRTKAKKIVRGDKLQRELEHRGIYIRSASFSGLAEEAGEAYKDISEVVKSVDLAGISKPVASFKPIGNIKG